MDLSAVHRLMERAVTRRCFPSACLLVALDGQPVVHRAYGRPDRLDVVYDVASLTKVLATTAVTMQLVAEGGMDPDERVTRYLPELRRPETRDLRLSHLLAHAAGLPDWLPLYRHPRVVAAAPGRRRGLIRKLVAATPLRAPVGAETLYSDLGFILLDWALERCSGQRLDRLAHARLFGPLGLQRTLFVDLRRPDRVAALRRTWPFAPTERCPWRGRRLVAEVHDDNCHAMGGVSGHAGLFSTAHDVHLLARELVAAYHGGRSLFDRQVVRAFLRRRVRRGASRVLGWDTPTPGGSSGRHFGPRSVGHLGYTGTSLWIDLERQLWVVLLTNRVYHGREPNPMRALRPRLHDAVLRALGLAG